MKLVSVVSINYYSLHNHISVLFKGVDLGFQKERGGGADPSENFKYRVSKMAISRILKTNFFFISLFQIMN